MIAGRVLLFLFGGDPDDKSSISRGLYLADTCVTGTEVEEASFPIMKTAVTFYSMHRMKVALSPHRHGL